MHGPWQRNHRVMSFQIVIAFSATCRVSASHIFPHLRERRVPLELRNVSKSNSQMRSMKFLVYVRGLTRLAKSETAISERRGDGHNYRASPDGDLVPCSQHAIELGQVTYIMSFLSIIKWMRSLQIRNKKYSFPNSKMSTQPNLT